jgi:hypothetical protein
MFNWQVQTTRTRPIVSRLPRLHQSFDANLYKPFVVANRLQALNFNVKGLQSKSSGSKALALLSASLRSGRAYAAMQQAAP